MKSPTHHTYTTGKVDEAKAHERCINYSQQSQYLGRTDFRFLAEMLSCCYTSHPLFAKGVGACCIETNRKNRDISLFSFTIFQHRFLRTISGHRQVLKLTQYTGGNHPNHRQYISSSLADMLALRNRASSRHKRDCWESVPHRPRLEGPCYTYRRAIHCPQ